MTHPPLVSRYQGALLGLATGDALGTSLEFHPPGSFEPITTMMGGGPFGLEPGQWTDDTSMALCLAESLLSCKGFNAEDQMQRYVRWWQHGHLSSTGHCFDIGITTRDALERFSRSGEPMAGSSDPQRAGNGSIMRLAPIPMAYRTDPKTAITLAAESSRTTHAARTCIDACRYLAGLIIGALEGTGKDALLADHYTPIPGLWRDEPLTQEIDEVASGSFKRKDPPEIQGSGYVVRSLEAALWAFHKSEGFKEGALLAVNLGDDADTTGAVYGQLAGAYYGVEGIPEEWLERLSQRQFIEQQAERLLALAEGQV